MRRFAWVPSPGSFTMKGYALGVGPIITSGQHSLESAIALPGNHSKVTVFAHMY